MNTEKIMEDIQSVQDNIREIKSTWGNTIMTMDNIKSGLKADVQKKVDEAYQRGLNDAWQLAECVIYNRGNVLDILRCATVGAAFDKYSARQALDILKGYESKQKDRIEVGDEVQAPRGKAIVTAVKDDLVHYFYSEGDFGCVEPYHVTKTGKHYDIQSILEAMRT